MVDLRSRRSGAAWWVPLAFVAGMAAGAGALQGYLSLPHEPAVAPATAPPAIDPTTPQATTPNATAAPAPSTATPSAAPAASRRPTEITAVAQALAAIPRPAAARGTGRITGSVRTSDKKPVAGVRVRAVPSDEEDGDDDPGRAKLDAEQKLAADVRDWVVKRRRSEALAREASTDGSGAYAIEGLSPVPYEVSGKLAGYEIHRSTREGSVKPDATVDLVARRMILLGVQIVLPSGQAPEKATVVLERSRSGTQHQRWTPAKPEVEMEPGEVDVSAFAGKSGEWVAEKQRVSVKADDAPAPIILQLKGRAGITGRIVMPEDEEPTDRSSMVGIWAMRMSGATPPDADRLQQEGQQAWARAPECTFEFLDLKPGTYFVGIMRGYQERAIAASQIVDVVDSLVTLDLAMPPVDPAKALRVRVLDPGGASVDNATFSLETRSANRSSSGGGDVVRKKDGTYWVLLSEATLKARREAKSGFQTMLTVQSEELGSKIVEVPSGATTLDVQFQTPATVVVTVAGYAGSLLEGQIQLSLAAKEQGGEQNLEWQARRQMAASGSRGHGDNALDETGAQTLGPVEPGDYEVVLSAKTGEARYGQSAVASRQPVRLLSGKNAVTVPLPVLHTLTVNFGSAGNAWLMNTDGANAIATVDETGQYVFKNLPAGTYQLTFTKEDGEGRSGRMSIEVPAAGPITFAVQKNDAILVKVTEPEGALAKAGFQTGDYIIAVDGTTFDSDEQMQLTFMAAMSKESTHLTVARGADTIEIDMDLRVLMKGGPRGAGGDMQPATRPR